MRTDLQWVRWSAICFLLALPGCEYEVGTESVLREDGSLERSIAFQDADSAIIDSNIFNTATSSGWTVTVTPSGKGESEKDKKKIDIIFRKNFTSVDDANNEMDADVDTLFRIRSSLDKKFRWFYTYVTYSDKYVAVNRFKLAPNDFFAQEDFDFIKRLPPAGTPLSLPDSIFESGLDDKISDVFVARAFFEEAFEKFSGSLAESGVEKRWLDTLARNKEKAYTFLVNNKDVDEDRFMEILMDSLKIPVPEVAYEKYNASVKELEKRIDFMSTATSGNFAHHMSMPWQVTRTNADSVSGRHLYWRPRTKKFMLDDYEMFAEARQLNYWTVVGSAVVILGGVFWLRKRRIGP